MPVAKKGCVKKTTARYTERNSPPVPANECPGMRKRGNDGTFYDSRANKNGVFRWVKVAKAKPTSKKKKTSAAKKTSAKRKAAATKKPVGCVRQTTAKYLKRQSPAFPANECCGKRRRGNDKLFYISREDKNGVCRWYKTEAAKKASAKKKKASAKKKTTSAKKKTTSAKKKTTSAKKKTTSAKKKTEALDVDSWMEEADRRGLFLTWKEVRRMRPKQKLVLGAALDQGYFVDDVPEDRVYTPARFFRAHKQVFESPYTLDGTEYDEYDGPFYEDDNGLAVTGSGADRYIEWTKLIKMPKVYYNTNE